MRQKRRQVMTALAGTLAVVAFLILSSIAVVWANGLRYNPAAGTFEQTVLVAIESEEKQALDVLLNGELVSRQVPHRVRNLVPGSYTIQLVKEGFHTWTQTFRLSPGQVGVIDQPYLIATTPLITEAKKTLKPVLLEPFDFGLVLENGELRDLGTLVTRFYDDLTQVHRFRDYFIYQIANELRIFIPQGNQDYSIYVAENTGQLPLILYTSTWQVAVADGESIKLINLTIPETAISD